MPLTRNQTDRKDSFENKPDHRFVTGNQIDRKDSFENKPGHRFVTGNQIDRKGSFENKPGHRFVTGNQTDRKDSFENKPGQPCRRPPSTFPTGDDRSGNPHRRPEKTWSCVACTFENLVDDVTCRICGSSPAAVSPATHAGQRATSTPTGGDFVVIPHPEVLRSSSSRPDVARIRNVRLPQAHDWTPSRFNRSCIQTTSANGMDQMSRQTHPMNFTGCMPLTRSNSYSSDEAYLNFLPVQMPPRYTSTICNRNRSWFCPSCTFLNEAVVDDCGICGTRRQ